MISYIADINTSQLLQDICKRKNILILNSKSDETDIKQYIKETKVNFNLIKYLFIDLKLLQNTDREIIDNIYNFSKIYTKARIIIFAPNFNEQNIILTTLYDMGFYNIINENNSIEIEKKLNTIFDIGLNKKDSKRFEKKEEVIEQVSKVEKIKIKTKEIRPKEKRKTKNEDMPTNMVYLFSLLLEAITRLVKFISYVLVFILTSIGLTILLNSELREILMQLIS